MAMRSRRLTTLLFSIVDKTQVRKPGRIPDRMTGVGSVVGRWFSSASSSAAAAAATDDESDMYEVGRGLKDYEDYRRSLYGEITHKALLVDAVGTLLVPAQPMAQIYRAIGEKYGVQYSEDEILKRYRRAYEKPWGGSRLRYVNDARPFWQYIVSASTGCSDSRYFEELYNYYTTEHAWKLCDPEAEKVFKALRERGVKVAVVSNFDTRLRPLLRALRCENWFDAIAVSAEVEAEKPNPTIFLKACELLGVNPEDAVHVGDDRRNDVWGARDAGCDAWLWGSDVTSFKEVAYRIGVKI
ncbi:PREDICTED: haloacid dehalogenase-like hydrolase domain-containing protein 3 [Tarenaya hassleriana]|uniref:haloacid dehalogenase-like hydrolase domain-containing protein 3 n=1 Tax=Tarenaya hassleriana TaxID=28532 RepID=UPI00053C284A|nr:PREDICTED: haloacid dehalogenase-like hydrolase domain-containing protein 3 [Tarenaya hassleriana]